MWVLIPSYEPDARLPELVSLLAPVAKVVVVDDGSGDAYDTLFDECVTLGAHVLVHPQNEGKAAALRTGFAWLTAMANGEPIVCADSDGQHLPRDILAVGRETLSRMAKGEAPGIVLGARAFAGAVPLRSRVGNRATSLLVAGVAGRRFADTQTGLRGYPPALLPWLLGVRGERFAYELRMLLEAARQGVPVTEVPIATVYLEQNASSHFRPVADSWRVLLPLFMFAASSLIAFGVDTIALLGLVGLTGNLLVSIVGARLLSATTNFTLNRTTVFRAHGEVLPQALRYAMLATVLLCASYAGLWTLTSVGLPLLLAKLITDLALFAVSYGVQRAHVFGRSPSRPSVNLGECTTSPESTQTTLR